MSAIVYLGPPTPAVMSHQCCTSEPVCYVFPRLLFGPRTERVLLPLNYTRIHSLPVCRHWCKSQKLAKVILSARQVELVSGVWSQSRKWPSVERRILEANCELKTLDRRRNSGSIADRWGIDSADWRCVKSLHNRQNRIDERHTG